MTRIWTDGAELGDMLFWTSNNNGSAETAQKRSGSYSYYFATNEYADKNITATSEFYLRAGWRIDTSGSNSIITWRNSTTVLGSLRINTTSHKFEFYVGTTLTDTGSILWAEDTWYLLEIHVKIANVGGTLELKVDGVADTAITVSGDTQPGTATTVDNLRFSGTSFSEPMWFDDLALNDTAGGVDDSWCGDGKVIFLTPNANGDSSDLTGSDGNSTDNYLLVDDIPKDDDTTYVQSAVSDDYDLYNLTACGLSSVTITRVWAEARAKDTVAAGGQIKLTMKTEATEYDSAAISLLTTYTTQCLGTIHTVNPQTSSAWTTTQLDALQVGPKVV